MTDEKRQIAEQLRQQLKRLQENPDTGSLVHRGAIRGVNDGILRGLKALGVNPYKGNVLAERNIDYGNERFAEGVEALAKELEDGDAS